MSHKYIFSPDDGHTVARNKLRKEINILRKILHKFGFIYKITFHICIFRSVFIISFQCITNTACRIYSLTVKITRLKKYKNDFPTFAKEMLLSDCQSLYRDTTKNWSRTCYVICTNIQIYKQLTRVCVCMCVSVCVHKLVCGVTT